MSLFGDIDVSELGAGPKNGVYKAHVLGLDMNKRSKAGGRHAVISFDIDDPSFDFPVDKWFGFPEVLNASAWDDSVPVDKKGNTEADINRRNVKFFTRTLLHMGVPEERLSTLTEDDLIGIPVVVTVEINDKGFPGIKRVTTSEDHEDAKDYSDGAKSMNDSIDAIPSAHNPFD